ncbi:MAG: hypothetical protein Fur0037_26300 [Planctomycetota bacterium]
MARLSLHPLVNEILCLAAGALVGASIAASIAARRARRRAASSAAAPPREAPKATERRRRSEEIAARTLASTLAKELATLASGVEGNAQLLIEAAADPSQISRSAERLWNSVQRLHRFHDKVGAYAGPPSGASGATDVYRLIDGLRTELSLGQLGLRLASHAPPGFPPVRGAPKILHEAMVGLCAALRHLERGAERLSVSVEPDFEDEESSVKIELHLEWDEEPKPSRESAPDLGAFEFEFRAAKHLLESVGGEVEVMQQRRKQARALVFLRAADASEIAAPVEDQVVEDPVVEIPPPEHPYAGVLLIESDPELRAMLASELKACGRAVFACPDSAAARTLLQATPERFEMLIVDREEQLDETSALAQAAKECGGLKLCVLSGERSGGVELAPGIHRIRKPFGVLELRAALKQALESQPVGR